MKRLEDIRAELKSQVANRVQDALQRLKEVLSPNSAALDQVLLQESRLHEAERRFYDGLLAYDKQAAIYCQACKALLELIDELKPEDLQVDTHSIFDRRVPRYKPDILRLDRGEAKSRFDEKFQRLQAADAQHYFIVAERHQQPRTFVERLIFDLEDRGFALDYERVGDQYVHAGHLDPGSDLDGAQLFLRQYLSKRFQQDLPHLSNLHATFPPSDHYDFIITVFEFTQDNWKAHTGDLLHWIVTAFSQPPPSLPTHFLFFYLIDGDLLSRSPVRGVLDLLSGQKNVRHRIRKTVERLETHPNCTLIPELKPVPVEEVITWLHDFVSNEEEIDRLIREILRPLENGADKKQLNMSYLEKQLMEYVT